MPAMGAVVLVLASAGCGSGGSASTQSGSETPVPTTASTVEKTQPAVFAQADAICRKMNEEFDARAPAKATIPEIARVSPRRADQEARVVSELSKLTPPASLSHDWQQLITYRRTLAVELAQLGRDAKANDVNAIQALAKTKKQVHEKLRTLAASDGLTDCGKTGTS